MKKIFVTAVLAALGSTAQAADNAAIAFEDLDQNGNGTLSVAETGNLPDIAAQWPALDSDADGQLSKDEFSAYRLPAPAAGTR